MKSLILFLILCVPFMGFSQSDVSDVPERKLEMNSPRATMFTFIYAVKRYSQNPELWEVVINTLDAPAGMSAEDLERCAVQLYGVLNRLGRVEERDLPDTAQVMEDGLTQFRFYPNAQLHSEHLNALAGGSLQLELTGSNHWQFSRSTVLGMSALYGSLQEEKIQYGGSEKLIAPSLWIRSKVPEDLRENRFVSLAVWQWIALFALILVGLIAELFFRGVIRVLVLRWAKNTGGSVETETMKQMLRPVGIFVGSVTVLLLFPLLGLHREETQLAASVIRGAILFVTVVSASWTLWRIADVVSEVLVSKAKNTESKVDDVLIPLVRKAVKIFIAVFGTIYAAESINLPIKPLLASLGIGGLAFAFAAKDTIENLFGSVAVILDRPFHVGDWVVIGKTEGTVEEIGFRSTRIRTFYNSQITVPNSSLVSAEVDNYGRRRYRRVKFHLGIEYNTHPDKIVAFTEGIRELVRQHPYTRKDYYQVYFNQFSASSLDILVYVFHETPDWSTELRERERLFLDILRLADRLGVNFAFPTQTLHLSKDENGEHVPLASPAADAESSAARMGRDAVSELIQDQAWREQKPPPV